MNKRIFIMFLGVLALSTPLFADKYETKSGKVYEGTMIDEDGANVYLDTSSGGSVNLKKADILNYNGKPYQEDDVSPEPANGGAKKPDVVFLDPSPKEKKSGGDGAEFTEEDLKAYYSAHIQEFRVPEQVNLKMLKSKTLKGNPEELLRTPEAIRDWTESGWHERKPDAFGGVFSEEEIGRIFSLQKGQTLSLTDQTGAIFLFWAIDRKEGSNLPFEEVKEKIQGELRVEKQAAAS